MKTNRWFNRNRVVSHLRVASAGTLISAAAAMAFVAVRPSSAVTQSAPTYNINTLAGKVASLRGTAGLQIRFSALIEQEAEEPEGIQRRAASRRFTSYRARSMAPPLSRRTS